MSATADWLLSSNYGTGEIDVFPLGLDGTIGPLYDTVPPGAFTPGPHPAQDGPHAHSTLVLGDTVLAADLGRDTVGVHCFVGGHPTPVRSIGLPPGTGPRDFAIGPDWRVFVLGELSGAILELGCLDSDTPVIVRSGQSTRSPVAGDHAAGLVVSLDGRRLYTGLRGSNRIAVVNLDDITPSRMSIAAATGRATSRSTAPTSWWRASGR
ncbi:MAG: lactonase family protein [Microbacteriaceae bacterium]|nr:lactonase family protein [Microbacteriaceae bacterium]